MDKKHQPQNISKSEPQNGGKGKLRGLKEFLKDDYAEWLYCDAAESSAKTQGFVGWLWQATARVRWAADVIRQFVNIGICHYRGHKWSDMHSIGPEGGVEYFYCTRCGESHTHVYF